MLTDRATSKSAQTRFNLLLLEDGEFFLDDFSVHRFLDPVPDAHRKAQGRLKVATRGFFFEPQDINQPILRFPFREMSHLPAAEFINTANGALGESTGLYLTFEIKSVTEMKERGVDHPYVQKETTLANADAPAHSKYVFALLHSRIEDFLRSIQPIWELAHRKNVLNKVEEEMLLEPILTPRRTDQFDSSLLVDFRERPLLPKGKIVDRIVPLLKYPGCLMLTNQRIYFQPAQLNNVGDPVLNWAYSKIEHLYKRRHMLKQTGLEICLSGGESFFFSFQSRTDRDEIYDMMVNQPDLKRLQQTDLESMVMKWQRREVSNYEYLLYLNNLAGRTKNDLTQYPVFPWILSDYESKSLDLNDPAVYRDLSKPVGALNEERLDFYKTRFEAMPRGMEAEGLPPPFLYGTHYSTPGYVLFYLVRMAPSYMLCLQNGKFDAADRLFRSIPGTWKSCLTNHADLKELIPAFFDDSFSPDDWLKNMRNLDLGTTQKHDRVGDVKLPPWASSPREFVRINQEALESEYVSSNIHKWIDLIFGFKQQGKEAIKADNLFYYLSYEGSVDLEKVTDPVEKCSLEAQIQEFGQTPTQLFASAHPARSEFGKAIEIATPEVLPSPRARQGSSSASANSEMERSSSVHSNGQNHSIEGDTASEPDEDGSQGGTRRSMFGFRPRGIGSIGSMGSKQAQRLVGGITAQIRKRINTDPPKKWGWTFVPPFRRNDNDSPHWAGSSPHMLHSGEVTSMVLGRDARALFSTAKDTTFKVSATADGTVRRNLSCNLALSCCDVSADEKYVFVGSWDNCMYMYSVEYGRVIDQVTAHDDGLSAIKVFDDRILTASWDGSVKVWHYSPSGFSTAPIWAYMDCEESVVSLDVNLDGSLGVAGTQNGFLYLFDLRLNEFIRRMPASPERHAEITGLSCCGSLGAIACVTIENELSLFTVDRLRIAAIDVKTDGQVRCLDSDSEYAVGGTSTGKLLFWKLDEPSARAMVFEIPDAHPQAISSVVVSHNGGLLVSAAVDGSIRIWKLKRKTSRNRLTPFF
ncbi:hypothetical protein Poli38472_005160 [Pythium oligandrum]|uniref:Protein FAN n=1 Tax=Pythium oligandrum TaxID=41045 RepID=A0A8K1CFU3_PYTOL|nr:hypothetical protein Poli38472_005160 [Pythium oligandrum]|eukprot:TMW62542.1 hypothetical protein Poli38472_005160 [Pythium oligandrum]